MASPFRLMVDIEENHDAVELFVHEPGRKLLVAATSGHGFIVPEDEVVAMTRKGKQVLNVPAGEEAVRLRAGRRRQRRRDRREPQDADLPAERAARDDARQGRAACSATRTAASPTSRRSTRRTGSPSSTRRAQLHAALAELRDWWGQRAQAGPPAASRASPSRDTVRRRSFLDLTCPVACSAGAGDAPSPWR